MVNYEIVYSNEDENLAQQIAKIYLNEGISCFVRFNKKLNCYEVLIEIDIKEPRGINKKRKIYRAFCRAKKAMLILILGQ
jgi:hypothetical protein